MGFVHDDEYYRCCCMKHVHKGAFLIGTVGLVLAVITAICTFLDGLIWVPIGAAVQAACYLLFLIGNRLRLHKLYLPILLATLVAIILFGVFGVLQLLGLINLLQEGPPTEKNNDYQARLSLLITNLIFTVLSFLFSIYAFYVIYRDYWYLRDEPRKGQVQKHKVVTEVSFVHRNPGEKRETNGEFTVEQQKTNGVSRNGTIRIQVGNGSPA